jgi:phosphoglucomutase/phosphomannomutase
MQLSEAVEKRVTEWLNGPYDEPSKAEVKVLARDPKALTDAFYTDLSFGTGGLRGLMGVGTNRMNIYTVRKATQGLANYIRKNGDPKAGVLIGFDSRHHSRQFALEAARILAGNKIPAYLLKELRPTPFISFACRQKKCQAAIMITASHNPKEYNGYKVYWSDGGQVVPPHDIGIMREVEAIPKLTDVTLASEHDPLIIPTNGHLDDTYLSAIKALQHFPEENKKFGTLLKIVYTSLHGTGFTLMPQALASWGFTTVQFVEKQIIPDGNFPTVEFPNPEYPETLHLGIEEMVRTKSDILIATDPDADRMGVAVMHQGKPTILNGNEVATVCVYFLCEALSQLQKMPPKGAFVTTIVTTELLRIIAQSYKKACFEVLTGFKYIGEKIHEWESSNDGYEFVFGAEESYGYLLGTHSRDKDGIIAGCLIAEIALRQKREGKTLVDLLAVIYRKYGLFHEKQASLNFKPGKEGADQIQQLMKRLRTTLPKTLCGQEVVEVEDFEKGTKENLPRSDVLLFRLKDQSKIIIRPSGTEPKIKVYAAVREPKFSTVEEGVARCNERLTALLTALQDDLRL